MVAPQGSLGTWDWKSIVGNMFPLLIVLSVIVLWAGITLEGAEEMLEQYAILAVMVPTMVDMGGNLGAILSSRLSTRFHLGTTELDPTDRVLWANVGAILALAATIFTALAIGAYALGIVIGSPLPLSTLLVISLVSGMSVAAIAIVFSFAATYGSYRMGIDPDDTTIPIVTNVVDVFGMVIFIGVSAFVLGF
ncbi:magnesium transporter [Natronobacterium gregoryi]|uniref:ABC transporter permease n=2 Tax=Natronobacterium gregoryi TaxID=44930 RepID=L0AGA3_NATGS|nr:magnesium transporter [Natronobacterium gregoryi]AFZ72444.1 cation transporter [Natronobacterium gregoryi SP2]ELY74316.1 MgtE integral membrane region [Natronobacterium gregoryi SP2]PLK21418.1 ABC transporter permease [Natronobacterium gregoryi SP2]SFI78412.1 mgtE-like transporter [Natronobacterium gregoryi]